MVVEWIWSSLDDAELQMLLKIALKGEKVLKRLLFQQQNQKRILCKGKYLKLTRTHAIARN